jgi:hypothetical protein
MEASPTDLRFAGSIPDIYDRYLVPLLFAGYATDLASRVAALHPVRVLEIVAGTGVVTRAMARALPGVALVATDLNQPMLDRAMAMVSVSARARWTPRCRRTSSWLDIEPQRQRTPGRLESDQGPGLPLWRNGCMGSTRCISALSARTSSGFSR